MAIPTNTVQQDGIGTVTADQYNTFIQGVAGLNGLSNFGTGGLQNFIGVSGMVVYVPGLSGIADGNQGDFYWNATGNANDGVNNVQPNGVALGCWTRVPYIISASSDPTNFTNAVNFASGGNVASATTTPIGAASGNNVTITGTTAITAFDTIQAGTQREVTFAGVLTLTYNATSLILPTRSNITTAANDTAGFLSLGSGNWICIWYQRSSGAALVGNGISSVNVQSFTSSGTYTPTLGMVQCTIEVQAGGGGGGGAAGTSSESAAAGGGGGGGYARKTVTAGTIGSSQIVTVGAGGSAGASTAGAGGTGGSSSVGSIVSASGGGGGSGDTASGSAHLSDGGSYGTGSGGDVNCSGTAGTIGFTLTSSVNTSGNGGASYFGGGALGVGGSAGGTGGVYGGGASGASTVTSSSYVGGVGAPGIVIITEYIG
jgi:hypothetical protein